MLESGCARGCLAQSSGIWQILRICRFRRISMSESMQLTTAPRRAISSPTSTPERSEWLGILLLIGGFLIFNLLTCNLYPAVWCDEVWFSEPAVNLVTHG